MGDEFDDTSLEAIDAASTDDTMFDTPTDDSFDIPESFPEDDFLCDSNAGLAGEDALEAPVEFSEDVDELNEINDPDPYDVPESFGEDIEDNTYDYHSDTANDSASGVIGENTTDTPTEFSEDTDALNEMNDSDPHDIPESFDEDTGDNALDIQDDTELEITSDFPEDADGFNDLNVTDSCDAPESFSENADADSLAVQNDIVEVDTGEVDVGAPANIDTAPSAYGELMDYMSSHNYGPQHASEYSQDPQWQELNNAYRMEQGMEPIDYGHYDWTDTHVDDVRAELIAMGIPEDSPALEAILQNEQQGIDAIRSGDTLSDVESSMIDIGDVSSTDIQAAVGGGFAESTEDIATLIDDVNTSDETSDTGTETGDVTSPIGNPIHMTQSDVDWYIENANDPESLRQMQAGIASGRIAVDADTEIPTDAANEGISDVPPEIDYDAVYSELDSYDFDGVDVSTDMERLDSSLENFQSGTWENLSTDEQKAAMNDLANYVKDVIGFDNPPDIVYYNNPVDGDYGGYSPDTNTLSVNEHMLYDNNEAADTVAHELWHAYQHERAMNPQSAKDYQYQYGFDNYIRPDDDFTAYQDQLVEAEARAFAQQFKDRLRAKGRGI